MAAKRRQRNNETLEEAGVDFGPFLQRLTSISRSLGVLAVRLSRTGLNADAQRIHFLNALGFDRHEIAGILGTTPQSVSTILSRGQPRRRRRSRGKN